MARKGNPILMSPRFVSLLRGFAVIGGAFIGSILGKLLMFTSAHILLMSTALLVFVFLNRTSYIYNKIGRRGVILSNLSLLFLSSLFFAFLKLFLCTNGITFFMEWLSFFGILGVLGASAVSGSGGDVNPQSNPEATSVSQVPNRHEAGPSNPGQWNSFPSVPSDLPALPEESIPSLPSLPSIDSDPAPVDQPDPAPVDLADLRTDTRLKVGYFLSCKIGRSAPISTQTKVWDLIGGPTADEAALLRIRTTIAETCQPEFVRPAKFDQPADRGKWLIDRIQDP